MENSDQVLLKAHISMWVPQYRAKVANKYGREYNCSSDWTGVSLRDRAKGLCNRSANKILSQQQNALCQKQE